jgi:two-component system sensor histidine kinase QseC
LRVRGGAGAEVEASRNDVAAALDNLIENALGYSPAGTSVTIVWEAGEWATLAVEDEGPGIAPEEADRVLERFFRGSASSNAPGTGLGLAVADSLARRWGGSVAIANRAGAGARAELRLPPAGSLPSPAPELGEALPGRG